MFVIAPATANIIAKAAHGIADDMVSTTLLATKAPVVIAPAMNTGMYDNPVTQENLKTLRARGFHIIEPAAGHLACGDSGRGKLPDTATLLWGIEKALTAQDLAGKTVLVTAGPTQEAMDPVRFLSNHSTLARWATPLRPRGYARRGGHARFRPDRARHAEGRPPRGHQVGA